MHIYRLILIHLSLSNIGKLAHCNSLNNQLANRYFHVGYLPWGLVGHTSVFGIVYIKT